MPSTRRTAFTLVELLVVVGIVGLLVSILLPTLASARRGARDVACKANLKTMMQAQMLYANANRVLAGPSLGGPEAEQWMPRLRSQLDESPDLLAEWSDVAFCPEQDRGEVGHNAYLYGINSFVAEKSWNYKPAVRGLSAAELIVLADKGEGGAEGIGGVGSTESLLRTDDGYAFWRLPSGVDVLDIASKHNNHGAFRHSAGRGGPQDFERDILAETHNPTGLNAAMLDGHVRTLRRSETMFDSGLWSPRRDWTGTVQLFNGGNCCN